MPSGADQGGYAPLTTGRGGIVMAPHLWCAQRLLAALVSLCHPRRKRSQEPKPFTARASGTRSPSSVSISTKNARFMDISRETISACMFQAID
jgi:hypothetical protein